MRLSEDEETQLECWIADELEALHVSNAEDLSPYILSIIKQDKDKEGLKRYCLDDLKAFLKHNTVSFVQKLIMTLYDGTYKGAFLECGGSSHEEGDDSANEGRARRRRRKNESEDDSEDDDDEARSSRREKRSEGRVPDPASLVEDTASQYTSSRHPVDNYSNHNINSNRNSQTAVSRDSALNYTEYSSQHQVGQSTNPAAPINYGSSDNPNNNSTGSQHYYSQIQSQPTSLPPNPQHYAQQQHQHQHQYPVSLGNRDVVYNMYEQYSNSLIAQQQQQNQHFYPPLPQNSAPAVGTASVPYNQSAGSWNVPQQHQQGQQHAPQQQQYHGYHPTVSTAPPPAAPPPPQPLVGPYQSAVRTSALNPIATPFYGSATGGVAAPAPPPGPAPPINSNSNSNSNCGNSTNGYYNNGNPTLANDNSKSHPKKRDRQQFSQHHHQSQSGTAKQLPENERLTLRGTGLQSYLTEEVVRSYFEMFGYVVELQISPMNPSQTQQLAASSAPAIENASDNNEGADGNKHVFNECLVQFLSAPNARKCLTSSIPVINNRYCKLSQSNFNIVPPTDVSLSEEEIIAARLSDAKCLQVKDGALLLQMATAAAEASAAKKSPKFSAPAGVASDGAGTRTFAYHRQPQQEHQQQQQGTKSGSNKFTKGSNKYVRPTADGDQQPMTSTQAPVAPNPSSGSGSGSGSGSSAPSSSLYATGVTENSRIEESNPHNSTEAETRENTRIAAEESPVVVAAPVVVALSARDKAMKAEFERLRSLRTKAENILKQKETLLQSQLEKCRAMADKLERSAAAGSASSRTTLSNLEGRIVDIQAQLRAVRQQLKDSQQQQHQQQQQQQLQSIQSTDTSGDPSVKEFHGVVSGTSSVLSPSASVSASSAVPAVVDTSHQQYAPHTAYSQRGSYTGGGSRSGYYSNGGRGEYYVSRGRGRGRGGDGESWYSSLSGTADDDGGISGAYSTRGRGRGRGGRGGRGRGAVPMSWSRENEEEKQREDTSNLTDEQSHEE